MALKLIKCIHCGFEFKIDVGKLLEEGEVTTVRSIIKTRKKKPRQVREIDINCTKCNKTFEYLVEL